MFSESEILEIINHKIELDEGTGYKKGGSSHLSYKTFQVKSFKTDCISSGETEITYMYTVYVDTEFTSYPDNPPAEYRHKKKITVNGKGEIVREGKEEKPDA